jgi:hypothetical protein
MKVIRLTEKPSNNQIYLNWDNVNWFYQIHNELGQSTKVEFNAYNVLIHESPEQILEMLAEPDTDA